MIIQKPLLKQQESKLNKLSGTFIVLDGPDGCGKSTQSKMLTKWIEAQGVEVENFRDPGATAIGEKIREILLNPEHAAMSVRTELLLYMAARAQLWEEKLSPVLSSGKCVVMDRWISSTCVYQGYAGGFGVENVLDVGQSCLERLWPDLTILLDVDLKTAAERMDRQLDRMEQKGADFHQKVRDGFLQLTEHKNVIVIDAGESIEQVHERIIEAVGKTL